LDASTYTVHVAAQYTRYM